MIGARMSIVMGRIKSFFNGSHYVAETYSLKYDKVGKLYHVEHYTMTREEEKQFHDALKIKEQEIVQMAGKNYVDNYSPILEQQAKAEKWAADVEKNRQKQLAENKDKKVNKPATQKKPKTDTPKMVANKPKRKYNKTTQKENG